MAAINRHLNILFPAAIIVILLHEFSPALIETYRKFRFSQDVDVFYNALIEAHKKYLNVEIGPDRWTVQKNGKILLYGYWKDGEKLGYNVPNGQLYFENSGNCRTVQGEACITEGSGKQPHLMTIVSDANRTYTITFDERGKPLIEYDDY